jgi:methionine-rich copper-binding protein CopC
MTVVLYDMLETAYAHNVVVPASPAASLTAANPPETFCLLGRSNAEAQ